jgi:hypothetical protein
LFLSSHSASVLSANDPIMGPNGRNEAIYFSHNVVRVPYLSKLIDTFVVLHPSKGLRQVAVENLQRHFARILQQ